MYLDSAYIAKFYLNERDSTAVRARIRRADALVSSSWAIAEVTSVFHKHMREKFLAEAQFRELLDAFLEHTESGVWTLIPVTDRLLRRVTARLRALPAGVYIRAADAIHLATAQEIEEREIWTSDRHMLAAAPHFDLIGRTA